MPWVQLKRIMASADKRRQRYWQFQAALRNLEVAQNMSLMFGGGAGRTPLSPAAAASAAEDRKLDPSTKITINERRDATDPEGAGQHQEEGDADDFLFWVKMKAQGYPVTLIDKRLRPTG